MKAIIGLGVAIVLVLGAGYYFLFMPQQAQAPVNTGAAGTSELTGQSALAGTWRSQTDAKFTREFRADGVVYDRYEGDATPGVGGSWGVVLDPSRETGLTVPVASLTGLTVIKMSWENDSIVTYMAVNAISDTSMTTTDLSGNGKVTVFTKI